MNHELLNIGAFLFDLNGTMIDDMKYHIKAWHDILNNFGANISMEQMKSACYGKNEELLERMLPGRFSNKEKKSMSLEKEIAYQNEYRPGLALINGLPDFLDRAKANHIQMAIGSVAIMFNIDFVLDGLNIRSYFNSIVSADDVSFSKPHPETYLKCADLLGEDPANCIVFEDSPRGVESAANAGMRSVVLTTMHTREEFNEFTNILCFVEDYTDRQLNVLLNNSN
ncbi:MAG: HAD family phosphatase [Ferruginibacter sp.]